MELTEKQAIELSIELWEWLAETGLAKSEWPDWKKHRTVRGECFLCEYDCQQSEEHDCRTCPYFKKFRNCRGEDFDTYYDEWDNANTETARKKYAKKFLKQLREIENAMNT